MPVILVATLGLIPAGILLARSVGDEAGKAAENTLPQLVTVAAAGLGLYLAFKAARRKG